MALVACARCGEETPEANLLYHQAGRICQACELDIDEADQTSRGVFATVIGGPIIVFIGSVMFCFGSMGGIPMFFAGVYGGWTGVTALLEAYRVVKNDDQAVGGLGRGMLVLSGLVTLLWSLPLIGVGLIDMVLLTGLVAEPRGMMQFVIPF